MNLTLPDGTAVTLAELQADVKAAQGNFASGEFCFTWPTVQCLLDKLDELDPTKTFTLFWTYGKAQLVTGATIWDACARAGLYSPALRALDWWDRGDKRNDYIWNSHKVKWFGAHNPDGKCEAHKIRKGAVDI